MSDPQQSAPNSQTLQGEPSPEELEAAQAANEADALAAAQGELALGRGQCVRLVGGLRGLQLFRAGFALQGLRIRGGLLRIGHL